MSSTPSVIGSNDRLGVTLLFSLIVHAVLALGITFSLDTPSSPLPGLDVILLESTSAQKPEKPDFLAQVNNTGGGDTEKRVRPTAPASGITSKPTFGVSLQSIEIGAPMPASAKPAEVLITSNKSDRQIENEKTIQEKPDLASPEAKTVHELKQEEARLEQEIQRETQAYAKRPKRKFLSANTHEYEYAAYQKAWVARIERIGNLNYPDEARRQQLHGDVLLTVSLFRNGRVRNINIIHSSGHKILDDAAIRIVRLAEPFPPLPKTAENPDEINITRTWQFLPGEVLRDSMSSE